MAQRTQTRPRAHRAWGSGSTSGGEFSLKLCFFELSFKSLRRELASSNTLADRIQRTEMSPLRETETEEEDLLLLLLLLSSPRL